MWRKIVQIAVVGLLAGCASQPELTFYHRVDVPEQFRFGGGSPYGTSPYERYLDAYERAFWACVRNRAENIDYQYTLGDIAGCGWGSEVSGYEDGYLHAEKMINDLVEAYGKEKTRQFIRGQVLGL